MASVASVAPDLLGRGPDGINGSYQAPACVTRSISHSSSEEIERALLSLNDMSQTAPHGPAVAPLLMQVSTTTSSLDGDMRDRGLQNAPDTASRPQRI